MLNMTHRDNPVTRAYSTQITHRTGPHIGRVDDYVRALKSIEISSCERDMLRDCRSREEPNFLTGPFLVFILAKTAVYI